MAEIYGRSQAEKKILDMCPSGIEKFEDIETRCGELDGRIKEREKEFFDALPGRIEKEKINLEKIRDEKTAVENSGEEIRGFFKSLIYRYVSKPWKLRKIKNSEIEQESALSELKERPKDVFEGEQSELFNEVEMLEEIKENPFYSGAIGELKALNTLRKLDERFHVFCDVKVELDEWYWYNDEKNLKSAQMDFVVVSRKGIFVIEVKNWSNEYYEKNKKNENITPHEQLDKAGKVLWIFLNSRSSAWGKDAASKITKILTSIKNNISYEKKYKYVLVSSLSRINDLISDRDDVLSGWRVKKTVKTLKNLG